MAQRFKFPKKASAEEIGRFQTDWQILRDEPVTILRKDNSVRIIFSGPFMKLLLGGKWPKFHGFSFDVVGAWELEPDGTLLPLSSLDEDSKDSSEEDLAPGPSFKLSISMVDDVSDIIPKIIRLRPPKVT